MVLLKPEFKKLFSNLIVRVILALTIALTIYTGFVNRTDVKDGWLAVFKIAEDDISIENYAAVLNKAQDADPFFWQIEMEGLPFTRSYVMTENLADYKSGDEIKYKNSPIYKTTTDDFVKAGYDREVITGAYGALFAQYKEYYHWEENRQKNVMDATKYYNWFVKRKTITDKARDMKRRADIYNYIKAPADFIVNVYWNDLVECLIDNKASYIFVIIAVAYLFGLEKHYKTRSLIMVTKTRKQVFYSKLLSCFVISIAVVILEIAIIIIISVPGGYFPGLFTARIQNLFWFIKAPFNMSIIEFLLMLIAIKLFSVLSVSAITAFTAILLNSISGAVLTAGFVTFIPLLFDRLYLWSKYSVAAFKNIYTGSIMALHDNTTWVNYVPHSFLNIPFMLHEYIAILWGVLGILCFVGCGLLFYRRNN